MAASPKDLIESGLPVAHLKIGECIFARRPILISTVLGSCVSATFFHPESGLAAMFHAMLPESSMTNVVRMPCNYVDTAVSGIHARFCREGVLPARIRVRLFGGANTMLMDQCRMIDPSLDVGRKNVESARRALAGLGFRIEIERTLGDFARKVLFSTEGGETWVRRVDADEREEYTAFE